MSGDKPPEGGVGAVVLGGVALVGETVGEQAVSAGGGVGFKDRAGLIPARVFAEQQAGERNHGVAAPVGEPGEASEQGPGAGGAAGEENVGGVGFAAEAEFVGSLEVFRGLFVRPEEPGGFAGTEDGFVDAAGPEGLAEVEAPLALDEVFVVAVPVFAGGEGGFGRRMNAQRAAEAGLGVLEGVVAPVGVEGAEAERRGAVGPIAEGGGGAAGQQEQGFFDKGVAATVEPARGIGLELFEPFVAAQGKVAGVLNKAEGVGFTTGNDLLFDAGEHHAAAGGRGKGGGEQGVVAAGIESADRAHGEAAGFVGFEPFQPRSGVEIPALCSREPHLLKQG